MAGYLNRLWATEAALRRHNGQRFMHTAGIAFMDDDGYPKVFDRSKDVLFVGGYKVFSAEVEAKVPSVVFV